MDHAEPSDADLLRELRSHPSEAAFRRLVERHLPTVWSTARRVLAAEPSLVDDVVQRVFTDLAGRVGTLRADGSLGPWLHRHTWFRATAALRAERRRRHRETTAAAMHEPSADEAWSDLAPHLDAALASLPEADRQAIVLRYFEDRSLRSVGDSLGLSEDSARKRVSRALEKLRGKLTRRGVTLGVAALASSLAAHAAEPAPVALAQTVSTAAWARRSAAGGVLGSLLMGLRVLRRVKWLALAIVVSLAVVAVVWMFHGAGNVGDLFAPTSPPTPRSPLPPGKPFRLRFALFALREADPGGLMPDVPEDGAEAGDLLTKFFDAAVRDRARLDQPADDQSPLGDLRLYDATLSGETGHTLAFLDANDVVYTTGFARGPALEPSKPTETEARAVGTRFHALVGRPRPDGLWPVSLKGSQTVHPHTWRVVPHVIDEQTGQRSDASTKVPVFHQSNLDVSTLLAPGQPELITCMRIPDAGGDEFAARRLFVFLTLDPVP